MGGNRLQPDRLQSNRFARIPVELAMCLILLLYSRVSRLYLEFGLGRLSAFSRFRPAPVAIERGQTGSKMRESRKHASPKFLHFWAIASRRMDQKTALDWPSGRAPKQYRTRNSHG